MTPPMNIHTIFVLTICGITLFMAGFGIAMAYCNMVLEEKTDKITDAITRHEMKLWRLQHDNKK